MEHPVRRQLVAELARLYRSDSSVQSVLAAANIRSQALISWADRPLDTWYSVLNHVEVQEQTRDLLDVVIHQFPEDAVFHLARNQELLRPPPKVPFLQPTAPLWKLTSLRPGSSPVPRNPRRPVPCVRGRPAA